MKLTTVAFLTIFLIAETSQAQTNGDANSATTQDSALSSFKRDTCTVIGATPEQKAALLKQIQQMQPEVGPNRVVFVPHWKYLDNARIFHLHVPAGYGSLMFTHLPSRTVFIDNDRYEGEKWLGHWIAHELGHLVTNSAKEEDAERAAREFRKRLRGSQGQNLY